MFRVAVTDIDSGDGWVKCGRCRKVFDCRKNEIDPTAFINNDENSDDAKESEPGEEIFNPSEASVDKSETVEDAPPAPQMPLFVDSSDKTSSKRSVQRDVKSPKPLESETAESSRVADSLPDNATDKRHLVEKSAPKSTFSEPVKNVKPRPEVQPQRHQPTAVNPSFPAGRIQSNPNHTQKASAPTPMTHPSKRAPGLSKVIIAKAQGWKKGKNRISRFNSLPSILLIAVLSILLLWQVAVVNYTKLSSYGFLSAPLAGICSLIKCNTSVLSTATEFEILHANLRRHSTLPNVVSISAKLINFSEADKVLPTVRLDITNNENEIIASRLIDLADNPQYVDPTISELAPGQDVKVLFNLNPPSSYAYGFELNLVENK